METTKPTGSTFPIGDVVTPHAAEWNAQPLRPVAHWVSMPTAGGRPRLAMVWEVPDPMPPSQLY